MPVPLSKIKAEALELIGKGDLKGALKRLELVVRHDPEDMKTLVKIGDLYRKLGRKEQAIEIYKKASEGFASRGFLLQAIGVNKIILEIDPNHKETQKALAELYTAQKKEGEEKKGVPPTGIKPATQELLEQFRKKKSPTTAPSSPSPSPPPTPTLKEPLHPEPIPEEREILVEVEEIPPKVEKGFASLAEVTEEEELESLFENIMRKDFLPTSLPSSKEALPVDTLPKIPLFSSLTPDEFVHIVEKLELVRFDVGDRVVKEGEEGDAFYIITQGACQVTKRDREGKEIVLTTLKEGDFFGEFAFFSNSVRQASVTVLKETEALKLSRKQLEEILAQFPRVKETLKEFYKERLIGTILAISPLFKPLPEEARKEILSAFQYKEVEAGTVLIRQGEEGKGLYVIIAGEVAVSVRTKKSLKEVARLKEGEFFGEISLLTDSPTTANCIAVKETSLFFLPREKFVELILTYPQILEVTSSIADERMKVTKPLLLSGEALTQAGLV